MKIFRGQHASLCFGMWVLGFGQIPAGAVFGATDRKPIVDLRATGAAEAFVKTVRDAMLADIEEAGIQNTTITGELAVEAGKLVLKESSNTCTADVTEAAVRNAARQCAAAIIARNGIKPVYGTRIFFTSIKNKNKEIWMMDWDGGNKRQLTEYNSITSFATVSPDNRRLAFTTLARGASSIVLMSLENRRLLPFYNQSASVNAAPEFTADGKLIFASTAHGGLLNLYTANEDGSGLQRLTNVRAVETEPKLNPKTGQEVVFTSGRSGAAQIYRMNLDGSGLVRLTTGAGEAGNPAWSPDGEHIAFSWKQAYGTGFQIFVMNTVSRKFTKITTGYGRNENPAWAPDGRHIAFSSNRSGRTQIWTMLSNGTCLRQLTQDDRNENPVWSH